MILGTVVKIAATIVVDSTDPNPDAATIVIKDPDGSTVVGSTETAMSGSGQAWSYLYQSSTGDTGGNYEVFIKATSGSYVAHAASSFTLDH